MVALTGPLATASRESRQARKGATVVVTLCAEVWLVGVTAIYTSPALNCPIKALYIKGLYKKSLSAHCLSPYNSFLILKTC
jgi:hypothetical protein